MPFIIGGVTAIVALAAGIIGQVDPIASLWRALLAFVLGYVFTAVWYAFFGGIGARVGHLSTEGATSSKDDGA
jgi:hypothetical protein